MSGVFHELEVVQTRPETDQATSVLFDVPASLRDVFRWRPGQHVTVRFEINGTDERRSYSISQPPGGGLRITVKRVEGGLISNHIHDHVRAGDRIDVMAPFGGFCLDPHPRARRTHYFFGAGSGITPLYSMIRSVLEGEPHSVAHLAYGNATAESILFREHLAQLERNAAGRLTVRHLISRPALLNRVRGLPRSAKVRKSDSTTTTPRPR